MQRAGTHRSRSPRPKVAPILCACCWRAGAPRVFAPLTVVLFTTSRRATGTPKSRRCYEFCELRAPARNEKSGLSNFLDIFRYRNADSLTSMAMRNISRKNNKRKGYILIAAADGLAVIMGAGGLAVDLGRAYIARSEVQAYTDGAAVAAAAQLNGTSAGILSAKTAAQNAPNKWNLETQSIANPTILFAQPSAAK